MGAGQDHRRRPRAAARARLQRLSIQRVVEVAPERLAGWVDRYAATHPGTVASAYDGGVRLDATTGAYALLVPLLPFAPSPGTDLIAALATHAEVPLLTALVLVRRGGYAVGVAHGPALDRSKVGSRYVQSRTAAGGWSQQRFARRREGQAKELVRAAAQAWLDLPAGPAPAVLVTGGDRGLCEEVLAEPALRGVRVLGVARHLDVPDPRRAVLVEAARRAQSVRVKIQEP